MFGLGTAILIISNKEMICILKITKSIEESGLLIKGVSKKNKNNAKEQKVVFLGVLFGSLDACLLGNLLTGKGIMIAGEDTITAGQDFQCHFIL